jgi:hypothetical protein
MDLGDPQGDGGGDLEISPLSLAIFVLMAEQERTLGNGRYGGIGCIFNEFNGYV